MADRLGKKDKTQVIDALKADMARDQERFELCQRLLSALEKWEGKQINKRIDTHLKELSFARRVFLQESYGIFRVEFYGNTPETWGKQIASFEIGCKDTYNQGSDPRWNTPGRINPKDIEERNKCFFAFPARLETYQKLMFDIPRLVQNWNAAVDALIDVQKEVEETCPNFQYGPFHLYIDGR